jgi:non-heme chloroperoxidase
MNNNNAQLPRFSDVQLSTGVRLRYAEQGDAAGHPVILLHGYTDSSFSFSRVLSSLAETYHVFALDQRGHGDSERPASAYAMTDYVADVVAFMDALGLARATLVGHCMGSFIAQRVATVAPQRVAQLVLVSSATTACNEVIVEFQEAVKSLDDSVPLEFVKEFQEGTVYHSVPVEFMEGVIAESLKLPAGVWCAVLAGLLEADDAFPTVSITSPTLILWGEKDSIFQRDEQEALVSALPHAVWKAYTDTGHSPHWEQPEQFVEDLKGFIASRKAQGV